MPKQPLPTPAAFCDKPYVHIPLTPVVSNQVAAIGYCPERKVLACTFTRGPGHVYHYPNVEPEFHAAFMAEAIKAASTHEDHQQMVKDCEDRESKLTDWERGFIDSIGRQLAQGRALSEKHAERLEAIWLDVIWERVT
jgi:hypothetical protein